MTVVKQVMCICVLYIYICIHIGFEQVVTIVRVPTIGIMVFWGLRLGPLVMETTIHTCTHTHTHICIYIYTHTHADSYTQRDQWMVECKLLFFLSGLSQP